MKLQRIDYKKYLVIILSGYIISYIILSSFGKYSDRLNITGRHRYRDWGMGMPDAQVWNPYMTEVMSWNKNTFGIIFYPLVLVDRKFWHKDICVFEFMRTGVVRPGVCPLD